MSPETPQPDGTDHVDYTGAPLRVGQTVTFIQNDQDRPNGAPRLYTGDLKLIGTNQIVIESGEQLFLVSGRERSNPRNSVRYVTLLALPDPPQDRSDASA